MGRKMVKPCCAIVILGASGDLAKRKLIPALSHLYGTGLIDKVGLIVGTGRTPFTHEQFRERFDVSSSFAGMLHYHQGIPGIRDFINRNAEVDEVVFFMALPPSVYAKETRELYDEGFRDKARIIIEKPFGYDYESAKVLNDELHQYYKESQIFRIDHYLAKEAVQNILIFRFSNSLFYPIWNSQHIESIQISGFEEDGVGGRAGYFDRAGVIRDMVQNHLTQLLCLATMEAPVSLDPEDIRAQKINVLKSIRVADCCRFQYKGYREEKGVSSDSNTETYAEIKLFIDNYRWTGCPIYIRSGKALNRKGTEIGFRLKSVPRLLFNKSGEIEPNKIVFKIQPAEGIIVDIVNKVPGMDVRITSTNMAFCYRDSFIERIPEAYERLLLDALRGDRTLFVSSDEAETSWKVFEPILDKGPVGSYEPGSDPHPCMGEHWINFEKYKGLCE